MVQETGKEVVMRGAEDPERQEIWTHQPPSHSLRSAIFILSGDTMATGSADELGSQIVT
jgi:hypothetical protein